MGAAPTSKTFARRAAARAALLLAGVAIALGATEAYLRISGLGSPTSGADVNLKWEPTSPYLQRTTLPATVFAPNYVGAQVYRSVVSGAEVHRVEVRTSAAGLRGPDADPAHRYPRVLGIGDSLTFGQGVEENDTFLAVFGRQAPLRLEVLNAGVPSWNLAAEVAWLEELGWPLTPDLVLICTYVNDVEASVLLPPEGGDHPIRLLSPDWAEAATGLRSRSNLANLVGRHFDRARMARAVAAVKQSRRSPNTTYLEELRASLDPAAIGAQYSALKSTCAAHAVPCIVVMLPVLVDGAADRGTDLVDHLARLATEAGLPVVRVDRALDGLTPFDRFVLPADQHPSRAAHAAIGRELAAELRGSHSLDELSRRAVE
ncbi:hypothetical protein LBMAG42_46090 [Deltaproteobacteria bacterium]|nr:hypothetical protein LBMAG42_46090 [Deltaproteobacteria bacterium]